MNCIVCELYFSKATLKSKKEKREEEEEEEGKLLLSMHKISVFVLEVGYLKPLWKSDNYFENLKLPFNTTHLCLQEYDSLSILNLFEKLKIRILWQQVIFLMQEELEKPTNIFFSGRMISKVAQLEHIN